MNDETFARTQAALAAVLEGLGPLAVAASGGVDSMTLACVAHRRAPGRVTVFHAVSPAVPPAATGRVREYALRERWALETIDAGEFDDPAYRANPIDRCFHCKHRLYAAIAARTTACVVSGTNVDDLGDYRPGLRAAHAHGVRHPYVDAGLAKRDVRRLAERFGLADLAALPASPCLASRVETGIRIEAADLDFIDRVEEALRASLAAEAVRCRLRREGWVLELDDAALARFSSAEGALARERLAGVCRARGLPTPRVERYRRGSAFVHP
jgi:uncharacterized protein